MPQRVFIFMERVVPNKLFQYERIFHAWLTGRAVMVAKQFNSVFWSLDYFRYYY